MNLGGLGIAMGGAVQGADAGAMLKQRALALQQGQMALDQEKKKFAAQAAAFANLDGVGGPPGGAGAPMTPPGQPPPTAMPMAPGQPSVPAQPQQQAAPAVAPPGGQAAPPPQAPPGGPPQPGQQPQGQSGALDPLDPQAPIRMVMQVAKEIKARNPNIDPQTLFQATAQIIDMSKGVAPALRQGAQVVIQQMRDQTSQRNTDVRAGVQERGQDMGASNVAARTASNEKIAAGHDATSLQRVTQQGQQAMDRVRANISAANDRATKGLMSREKVAAYKERMAGVQSKLRAATSTLTSLTNAGVKSDDPRVTKAAGDVEAATKEIDRVNKAAKMDEGGGQQYVTGQVYTDANGNKATWDGTKFVPQ